MLSWCESDWVIRLMVGFHSEYEIDKFIDCGHVLVTVDSYFDLCLTGIEGDVGFCGH